MLHLILFDLTKVSHQFLSVEYNWKILKMCYVMLCYISLVLPDSILRYTAWRKENESWE